MVRNPLVMAGGGGVLPGLSRRAWLEYRRLLEKLKKPARITGVCNVAQKAHRCRARGEVETATQAQRRRDEAEAPEIARFCLEYFAAEEEREQQEREAALVAMAAEFETKTGSRIESLVLDDD